LALLAAEAGAQQGPALVSISEVIERDVAAAQSFVGTVMPLRTSAIGSAVDGRVLEYPVNEGDRVTKGQPLAQLLTETLQIELAAAEAELELRRQELAELENGSRPEEIEQAKSRMLAAKADLEYWEPRLERTRSLVARAASTDEDLQFASSSLQRGRHTYAEAKAAYDLAVAGPRHEKIAQARARVQMQEQAVRRIEDQIAKHTIRSPFDGYVVAERTEIGAWVSKGQVVAEVVELDTVDVQVNVLENYVSFLDVGTPARVEVGALPNQVFTGEVALIVPQADVRSRTFPVKVRLKNQTRGGSVLIKAGMLARAALPVGKREAATLVSKDAVVLGGPTPLVYVFEPDEKDPKQGKVRPVPVELGVADDGLIQVRGPIDAKEQVVVQGNERLRPGQQVAVAEVVAPDRTPIKAGNGAAAK
jgi:RND family efflux transporter MFP subunit